MSEPKKSLDELIKEAKERAANQDVPPSSSSDTGPVIDKQR